MPQIIAADYLRSEFSVQIGWLVTDPKNPHNDHSPYELPPPEDSIIISEQEGIFEHNRSTYSSRIQGMLTKFLSLSASNGNSNAAQLVAGRGRRYMLENSGKYFRSLLQTEPGATETKKWMEEAILNQGEDVFLVIGLATVRDGNLERYTESNSRITGEATVPLAGAVGGAAQVVVGNVSASVSHNREDGNRVRFTGVGEQVYAVEYRKVKFRFLRSKEIDKVEDIHKRVIGDGYTIAGFLADVLDHAIRDQRLLSVGGNTGKPSTFTLIDIDTLTGGTFDATTLLEGNNLECFVF
ncbi:hypothetical protein DBV05_g8745 [Lasiodiplodia theobromae]|uniref:Uncharacterized protein n=1 Tax=Lasiodiplodia theobromae TaxID=45133 RepID=A0A5N5D4C1_9PEZI|nr:hypothetical protein DBV05_g8745 [Lasiodiplodia theobromae]